MNELMRLKGTNGTVVVFEDKVVIERSGLVAVSAQGFKGNRTYFYNDLSSVEYKKPGMTNGYIQFITAGNVSKNVSSGLMGSSADSMRDENTVILRALTKNAAAESDNLYNLIMERLSKAKSCSAPVTIASSSSGADEILKYKKLMDDGIITASEFEAKKKQLLGL